MSRLSKLLPVLALLLLPTGCGRPEIQVGNGNGNGSGIQLPTTKLDASTLVATISHGETVDLEDHLAPGTWTLLEFGADW